MTGWLGDRKGIQPAAIIRKVLLQRTRPTCSNSECGNESHLKTSKIASSSGSRQAAVCVHSYALTIHNSLHNV